MHCSEGQSYPATWSGIGRAQCQTPAGYPVRRGFSVPSLAPRNTGSPGHAGRGRPRVWRVRISRTPPHSRGTMGPSFARQCPSIIEGAGNAGRPLRPKPRVRNKTKHTSVVTTVTPEITRHSPRNGFTVSFVLFPVTSLFDTVACASSHRLDASIGASEPHDFTVRCSTFRQAHCPRPPHPAPRS